MIHYDPDDWNSHLFDIRGSMIREIFARVATCVLWSVAVLLAHLFLLNHHGMSLAIPETAHALTGTALGLLLVFRTNASYDRFWEGRKQWGAIVNECRNMGRAVSIHLAAAPDLVRPLLFWTSAFAWSTKHRLRGESQVGAVSHELPAEEVQAVLAENHTPLAVSRRMTALLVEGRRRGVISDYIEIALEQNVQQLIDYMGACERIHNTPIPFAYMVHLRRALILFAFTLPFALLDRFNWGMPLAVLLIAYVLYGIEEIGVEIEDPFGEDENDLPLEVICATIENNLRGVWESVETRPAAKEPDSPASR